MPDEQPKTRARDSSWWDRHVSMGSVINLVVLVFFFGGFYFVTNQALEDHAETLTTHSDRLTKIEDLQVRMAEVILRQTQFSDQLNRVEERLLSRYTELARRVESLEQTRRTNGEDQ